MAGAPRVRGLSVVPPSPDRSGWHPLGSGSARRAISRGSIVAVYERPDPNSLKLGKLVKQYLDPKVLTTDKILADEQAGEVTSEVDLQFEMRKGDYLLHVFLCNPDRPVVRIAEMQTFIDTLKLPGDVKRVKLLIAHVE